MTKSRRMRWAGHVAGHCTHTTESANVKVRNFSRAK